MSGEIDLMEHISFAAIQAKICDLRQEEVPAPSAEIAPDVDSPQQVDLPWH